MEKTTLFLITLCILLMPIKGNVFSVAAQDAKSAETSVALQTTLLTDDFESYSTASPFPAGSWINHNSGTSVWSIVSDGTQAARQSAAHITLANNIVGGSTNPLYRIITAPITSIFAGNIAYPTGTATVGMTGFISIRQRYFARADGGDGEGFRQSFNREIIRNESGCNSDQSTGRNRFCKC